MNDIVIVAAARTAVGKFGGTLARTPASELGAIVIKALLERARLDGGQIGEVIPGQVLTAGVGQNPARQAVIKSGLRNGGQESMSLAQNVLNGSRDGQRMGDWKLVDSMIVDGLWDVYNQVHMGDHGRERGSTVRHHARGAGRAGAGQAPISGRPAERRCDIGRTRLTAAKCRGTLATSSQRRSEQWQAKWLT